MTKVQAQAMSHELTIEYIRTHPEILSGSIDTIEDMVDKIADINIKFYTALNANKKFDKVYL